MCSRGSCGANKPGNARIYAAGAKENLRANADDYVDSLFAVDDDDGDELPPPMPSKPVPAKPMPAKPSFNDQVWLESQTQLAAAPAAASHAPAPWRPRVADPPAPARKPVPPAAPAPAYFNDDKWLDMDDDDAFCL